ncbi:helix-turn-helix domain-containing protein [Streptomyces fructofermentans]|uniref:HTH cro/C1-type domain-containing protein n=1 Tax=Streptomyces fructofermentans TaxID=152141 RepID=A0A918NVG2_9ACTN|nr:helix-turn-helix transcriptional regulator [Streptomyces fructofermentans]GGX99776.1 hypothetical protein GCM10010515_77300 [Streptomyces fructofermentans]
MHALPDDDDWLTNRQHILGARVRSARVQQNLTQEQLHLAAEISRDTLQSIEAGRGNPTLATLLRLAHVMGVPVTHLLE